MGDKRVNYYTKAAIIAAINDEKLNHVGMQFSAYTGGDGTLQSPMLLIVIDEIKVNAPDELSIDCEGSASFKQMLKKWAEEGGIPEPTITKCPFCKCDTSNRGKYA